MPGVVLIAHNIRSCLNVGSMLRTAEGLGVGKVYLTGYTPYPAIDHDPRLPHLARKIDAQIHKTALGAEQTIPWEHNPDIRTVLMSLRQEGYLITALEQTAASVALDDFKPAQPVALVVGREVEGIEPDVLAQCQQAVEIPMKGAKESFNVSVAAAIALYRLSR